MLGVGVCDEEEDEDEDTGPTVGSTTSKSNLSSVSWEFPPNRASAWFLRIISCTPATLNVIEKRTIGGFWPLSVALTPSIGRNIGLLGSQSMQIP